MVANFGLPAISSVRLARLTGATDRMAPRGEAGSADICTEAASGIPVRSHQPAPPVRAARPRGFTLVELLVVIAIIGVLVALLLPAVQAAREAARRMQCTNNLKQLMLAMHNYHDVNRQLPIGANTTNGLSWRVGILPFIEEQPLYDQFNFGAGQWNAGTNNEGPNKLVHALVKIPMFKCPSHIIEFATNGSSKLADGRQTYNSDYHGVAGPKGNAPDGSTYKVDPNPAGHGGFAQQGILYRNSNVNFGDVRDGLSRTIGIGEVNGASPTTEFGSDGADWVRGWLMGGGISSIRNVALSINTPYNSVYNDIAFGSRHAGGAQFARVDGSAEFLSDEIDITILKAVASRNGDESNSYDLP